VSIRGGGFAGGTSFVDAAIAGAGTVSSVRTGVATPDTTAVASEECELAGPLEEGVAARLHPSSTMNGNHRERHTFP
jgi:hypothetical protein